MSYVFVGHGWNLNQTIDLTQYNASVIMLSQPTCLFDENRKHKQLLIKYGQDLQLYMTNLLHPASESKEEQVSNEFCMYRKNAPQLLLTSYSKKYEQSATFLQKIGQVSAEKVQKVMLLSEILQYISEKENRKPFLLIVYACRCPLDHFQLENIEQFGREAEDSIKNFVEINNIRILEEYEKGSQVDCEFFT
jgi:signal transduction protein with GAF and PtsI domain